MIWIVYRWWEVACREEAHAWRRQSWDVLPLSERGILQACRSDQFDLQMIWVARNSFGACNPDLVLMVMPFPNFTFSYSNWFTSAHCLKYGHAKIGTGWYVGTNESKRASSFVVFGGAWERERKREREVVLFLNTRRIEGGSSSF